MRAVGLTRRPCLPVVALVAVILCVVGLAPAQAAEWKNGEQLGDAVANAVGTAKGLADIGDYGFKPDLCILGAFLDPGGEIGVTEELEDGATYLVIGGGDNDAKDVDIAVSSGDRAIVNDDTGDNTPYVHFKCEGNPTVTVHVKLADAPKSSFVAIAILKKGGYDVPVDNLGTAIDRVLAYADTVAEVAEGGSFLAGNGAWALMGAMLDEGQSHTMGDIPFPAGKHAVVGECDGQAQDVDLQLLDGNGQVVAQDEDEDATPLAVGETGAGAYSVKMTNAKGQASLVCACIVTLN